MLIYYKVIIILEHSLTTDGVAVNTGANIHKAVKRPLLVKCIRYNTSITLDGILTASYSLLFPVIAHSRLLSPHGPLISSLPTSPLSNASRSMSPQRDSVALDAPFHSHFNGNPAGTCAHNMYTVNVKYFKGENFYGYLDFLYDHKNFNIENFVFHSNSI